MILLVFVCTYGAHAETGEAAWLHYAPVQDSRLYAALPGTVISLNDSVLAKSAARELLQGVSGMLRRELRVRTQKEIDASAFVIGTVTEVHRRFPDLPATEIADDAFYLKTLHHRGHTYIVIAGANERGILYGAFALLRRIAQQQSLANLDDKETPAAPIRWVDQWDNPDGSIERGYAGRSIFFDNGHVRSDLTRVSEYARLLASVGINGCNVNNVNAAADTLSTASLEELARIADAFRPWGVRMALSVNIASPQTIGHLDTFDPLDPRVEAWWKSKTDEVYRLIPDFAGFTVKADSEGQLGPSNYGRTPADAANTLARALKPHGGVVLYRAFVYNHHLDWRDPKADRARAAYDIFHPLDGEFEDNVVLQIKHGPIDFQAREPVSPLIGGLGRTNEAMEVQVTQEYTGQQRHLCFLVPMWKEVLDFHMYAEGSDLHAKPEGTPVKELIAGKSFHRPLGGMVGVANVGLDANWLAHPLAMANLYGFARLAWNPDLTPKIIAEEWTRLTFGNDPEVVKTITAMQLASWHIYESYTGPLGAGTMTDIIGVHYGPGIESSERNGWGQWHRADHDGIGMDRTVATGTGYIGQYHEPVAAMYESLATCPDALLLFMHHVPYTYRLHSGKTVIQHIYDSHYEGAEAAANLIPQWQTLKGRMDDERYEDVLNRLTYQAGHAIVWRDAISEWFLKTSGIPDDKGRAGHHPNRVEAESMQLKGYAPVDVTPWETASGGKAVICELAEPCSASFAFSGKPGRYQISAQYFDTNNGAAGFRLLINGKQMDAWTADDSLPSPKMNGHTSTRHTTSDVALQAGDTIQIEGLPDHGDKAGLDYVEIDPE
ncbi:alpha-glucuronidase family glycosyl hydrolase [Acidobacterium sp. S8]|uniref:alpha-glucuronidase family glycosyl hydrolase n=1 Tax=Acidobacterium sp. S8 TaxID=1641854 RepID=UPI00131C9150|nr:alpha-glucuronidase family glycosyl hydrolase [Acidobacterium sp. S8]